MLKNGHLLRFRHPSSLRRTTQYASLLRISGGPRKRDFAELNLHLAFFEQTGKDDFFSSLVKKRRMTANSPNTPFELFAVIRLIRENNLFTRAFHPLQELRKVPDLKICGYLALFEINLPVLEMKRTLKQLDRAVS